MRKSVLAALACLLAVPFLLTSCAAGGGKTETRMLSNAPRESQSTEASSLGLNDPVFPVPDRIVFYNDGQTLVFAPEDPKFAQIFQQNNQRTDGTLEALKCVMLADNVDQARNLLAYEYPVSGADSLYFSLESSTGNYVMYRLADSPIRTAAGYGYLADGAQVLALVEG